MAFYYLTQAVKRRIVDELKHSFSKHPVYKDLPIQMKFSDELRVQGGIIVRSGAASVNKLDPSNFLGNIFSKVSVGKVGNYPAQSIEWVRENFDFPPDKTDPGVYFVKIIDPTTMEIDQFHIVDNEILCDKTFGIFLILNTAIDLNDLEVLHSGVPLIKGIDYEISHGQLDRIIFKKRVSGGNIQVRRISTGNLLIFGKHVFRLLDVGVEYLKFAPKYRPTINMHYEVETANVYTPSLKIYQDGCLLIQEKDYIPEFQYSKKQTNIYTRFLSVTDPLLPPQKLVVTSIDNFPESGTLKIRTNSTKTAYSGYLEEVVNYTGITTVGSDPAFILETPLTYPHLTNTRIDYVNLPDILIEHFNIVFRTPILKTSCVEFLYHYYDLNQSDNIDTDELFLPETVFQLKNFPIVPDTLEVKINNKYYLPEFELTTETYLSEVVDIGDTIIKVEDTSLYPSSGTLYIDGEYINYSSKNDLLNQFTVSPTTEIHFAGSTVKLKERNWLLDNNTGKITFYNVFPKDFKISVAYRAPGEILGPFEIKANESNVTAIPGVVIAFGNKITPGDKQAVMVEENRIHVADEYGGKWEITVSLLVTSRDLMAQEEIADLILHYLWHEKKNDLDALGLTITNISHGGESEETYHENTSEQDFTANIDITMLTDWSIVIPRIMKIRDLSFSGGIESKITTYGLEERDSKLIPLFSIPKIKNCLNEFERIF